MSIVKNPVHPLDLSLNSLMVIYKKFEEAKRLTGNPNQYLSVDLIVQLISRLIDRYPSVLHKELCKSLYKTSISWNEFLNFLDKESEARENILNWIMYEMNVKQYRFLRRVDLRFVGHFYEICHFQTVMCEGKEYGILLLDKARIILYSMEADELISEARILRKPSTFDDDYPMMQSQLRTQSNIAVRKYKITRSYISRSPKHRDTMGRAKTALGSKITKELPTKPSEDSSAIMDEEQYLIHERKKITSVFDVFKQLPIEESVHMAYLITNKIQRRQLNLLDVTELRNNYKDVLNKKRYNMTENHEDKSWRVKGIQDNIRKMQDEKRGLSYNPYMLSGKLLQAGREEQPCSNKDRDKRRRVHERKHKYSCISVKSLAYLEQHLLFALAMYNFEVVLLQVVKYFNKLQLVQQDRIEIPRDNDKKRNELVEKMSFHFHQIFNSYQLLILYRSESVSYVRCFNIIQAPGKGGGFSIGKESYLINLQFLAINLIAEYDFGFHVMCNQSILKCYKDNLTANDEHYTMYYSQKLKPEIVPLCMAVSKRKRKMMMGAAGGTICFYDNFARYVVMNRKISYKNILTVMFDERCSQALAFSADDMVTIFDANKLEMIQALSVKNEEKLNERVSMMSLSYERGYTVLNLYGSEFRQFVSFVDEDRYNQKRKIECTYQWRLNKMSQDEEDIGKVYKPNASLTNDRRIEELFSVVATYKYFVVMSRRHELKIFSKKSYKIKYSLVLALKTEQSMIAFNLTQDSKIIAYSTEDQRLHLMNIYTEEVYQVHEEFQIGHERLHLKFTQIEFLSERNEYYIVAGSYCGKICFLPSYLNQGRLQPKILQSHQKTITCIRIVSDYMLTAAADGTIIVWQLPFNIVKFELNVAERKVKDFILHINYGRNFRKVLCRGQSGAIYEIDAKEGVIKDIHYELSMSPIVGSCYNYYLNYLYIVDEDMKFSIFEGQDELKLTRQNISSDRQKKGAKKYRTYKKYHGVDIPSKWRIKSISVIKEKGINDLTILSNMHMGAILFFLPKDGFYLFDQLYEKFKGKYSYSSGYLTKYDQKTMAPYIVSKPLRKI